MPMFTQKSPLSAPLVQETPPAWRKQASSPLEPPQQQLGSVFPGAILHCRRILISVYTVIVGHISEGLLTAAKAVDENPATKKRVLAKCML